MTLFLGADSLDGKMSQSLALLAMEEAFSVEAAGGTELPARIDVPSGGGFIRVMPGVLDDVMGLKVMTLAEGVGTRYFVLLYEVKTGALLAMFDADELTRYRTAATTALAARHLVDEAPRRLGLLGSGFEAVGELRALAALWPLEDVLVFSPTPERRKRFAEMMQSELGIAVRGVDSCIAAVEGQRVVVLATKSTQPVVEGAAIAPESVLLSIGSTRLDLRELDRAALARAGTVVGDDVSQLQLESGDIADAVEAGALAPHRLVALSSLCTGQASLRRDRAHDLLVFKSVGTALQDLAIARAAYRDALAHGYGVQLGELATLKPFASKP
ncbi:MAG: ornithine cyclodeaminase family protein [Actinomycetota bacterium]